MISFAEDADGSKEKFEIPKSEKDSFLALTRQELEKVTWCAKYNRCPEMLGVLMMIFMGIRLGEICALSCDDIDLDRREIRIHQSVHRVKKSIRDGGSRTENKIAEIPTKTQIRTERIPEALTEYIEEFMKPGMILLTGLKSVPMEAKTLRNRVDRIFDTYRIKDMPFQRFRKNYVEGKADISVLEADK